MTGSSPKRVRIPRDPENDYTAENAAKRQEFVREQTGVELSHVGRYSFDPGIVSGNIENFTGVAQVPIGIAGPLRINGEHAKGDFYIPLATTEGTLIASYNRGMRLLTECGGVRATVVDEHMQRAPVFIFDNALEAREFGQWVGINFDVIKKAAETTTSVGKLTYIGQYHVGPLLYLRFNFTTGDAAGQNMTGKATLAACEWIKKNYPEECRFVLSGNIDTDKKHSRINMLQTRGRRVVAEAVIKKRAAKGPDGYQHKGPVLDAAGVDGWCVYGGVCQQWRSRCQWPDGPFYCHRARRSQHFRISCRGDVPPTFGQWGLLLVDDFDFAHCGHVWRGNAPCYPKRMPANAGLFGQGEG